MSHGRLRSYVHSMYRSDREKNEISSESWTFEKCSDRYRTSTKSEKCCDTLSRNLSFEPTPNHNIMEYTVINIIVLVRESVFYHFLQFHSFGIAASSSTIGYSSASLLSDATSYPHKNEITNKAC